MTDARPMIRSRMKLRRFRWAIFLNCVCMQYAMNKSVNSEDKIVSC